MNRLLTPALSLAVLAVTAGCMSPPKDLDLTLTQPTVDNKYVVTLQPPPKPATRGFKTLSSAGPADIATNAVVTNTRLRT